MTVTTGLIDPLQFRDALGHYASGITVVTGLHTTGLIGLTCQSFYSVSLDPPLISISVARTSRSYPLLREGGRFCVNVLAQEQTMVSDQFGRRGTDKWTDIEWTPSPAGLPTIDGSLLWLECRIEAELPAGDHLIVVGRVQAMETHDAPGDPLLYFRGGYHCLI